MRNSNKPLVRNNILFAAGWESSLAEGIRVGSECWHDWLCHNQQFVFESDAGHFTARRELRRNIAYWYAYRRREGRLLKAYLGKSEELTGQRLQEASIELAGEHPVAHLSRTSDSDALLTALTALPDSDTELHQREHLSFSVIPLTKFEPPVLPEKLISRQRLTERMKAPVTFIYTPSGFGKTTLLNEWRQTCDMPVAWVSLDADDDQPLRFWLALGTALQMINPRLGQMWLRQFHIVPSSPLSEAVLSLVSEIIRATDAPGLWGRFALVMDDYHHIRHPDIHASLQTLLEHLPPALRLVISSRIKPPLVLGQLRARGVVTELDTDDLRFTLEEGIEFLQRYSPGRQLSFSEMQALVNHTEGWVAGLNLAALAHAKQYDRQQVMTAFTGAHTYLREYFMESVLYRQPPGIQSFLFKTAILRHLTAPLCEAVTGQRDAADILDRLWQENLFLVRLEEQGWFRYHDLFAEMLYSQLQLQFPTEIPRLHRRAAEWYCAHNAPADAVYHLLAIQAWEEAASLIERVALRELKQSGEDSRLLRWLHQLPESVVQQHKTLLFVYVRLAGSALPKSEVEGLLGRIEANISRKSADELTADERDVLTDIRQIRHIARTGHSMASHIPPHGENEAVWQLLDGILTYQRSTCPELKKAAALAREVYEVAKTQQNLFVILMAGGALALYNSYQGYLRQSERVARQVLQLALTHRRTLPEPSSIALVALSHVCYDRNQLTQAHQFLLRATEVDPNPMSSNLPIMVAIQRAKIESAQGQGEAALATLQAARELQTRHPSGVWQDQDLLAYQAQARLRQGDDIGAEQILNEIQDGEARALCSVVWAENWLCRGRPTAAEELLTYILRQYPHGFHQESVMGARVLLAQALFAQHKVNEACQVMSAAIRLAEPEGFIRPFLDHGSQCAPLLTVLMEMETLSTEAAGFVREIMDLAVQVDAGYTPPTRVELVALTTAASISSREQEILRLVSEGLSNQRIAAQFSISVSTVKTHLDNIYRKLGVSNRTQAVAEARLLKLV